VIDRKVARPPKAHAIASGGSRVSRKCDRELVAFLANVNLTSCHVGELTMPNAQLHGDTWLIGAQFHGPADLQGALLHGDAYLIGAAFHESAYLIGVQSSPTRSCAARRPTDPPFRNLLHRRALKGKTAVWAGAISASLHPLQISALASLSGWRREHSNPLRQYIPGRADLPLQQ
jgi:hypothetical protein